MKTYPCGCIGAGDGIQLCDLHSMAPKLLAMLKNANHALYVIGKPSAVKAALAGSKELIHAAEGKAA